MKKILIFIVLVCACFSLASCNLFNNIWGTNTSPNTSTKTSNVQSTPNNVASSNTTTPTTNNNNVVLNLGNRTYYDDGIEFQATFFNNTGKTIYGFKNVNIKIYVNGTLRADAYCDTIDTGEIKNANIKSKPILFSYTSLKDTNWWLNNAGEITMTWDFSYDVINTPINSTTTIPSTTRTTTSTTSTTTVPSTTRTTTSTRTSTTTVPSTTRTTTSTRTSASTVPSTTRTTTSTRTSTTTRTTTSTRTSNSTTTNISSMSFNTKSNSSIKFSWVSGTHYSVDKVFDVTLNIKNNSTRKIVSFKNLQIMIFHNNELVFDGIFDVIECTIGAFGSINGDFNFPDGTYKYTSISYDTADEFNIEASGLMEYYL